MNAIKNTCSSSLTPKDIHSNYSKILTKYKPYQQGLINNNSPRVGDFSSKLPNDGNKSSINRPKIDALINFNAKELIGKGEGNLEKNTKNPSTAFLSLIRIPNSPKHNQLIRKVKEIEKDFLENIPQRFSSIDLVHAIYSDNDKNNKEEAKKKLKNLEINTDIISSLYNGKSSKNHIESLANKDINITAKIDKIEEYMPKDTPTVAHAKLDLSSKLNTFRKMNSLASISTNNTDSTPIHANQPITSVESFKEKDPVLMCHIPLRKPTFELKKFFTKQRQENGEIPQKSMIESDKHELGIDAIDEMKNRCFTETNSNETSQLSPLQIKKNFQIVNNTVKKVRQNNNIFFEKEEIPKKILKINTKSNSELRFGAKKITNTDIKSAKSNQKEYEQFTASARNPSIEPNQIASQHQSDALLASVGNVSSPTSRGYLSPLFHSQNENTNNALLGSISKGTISNSADVVDNDNGGNSSSYSSLNGQFNPYKDGDEQNTCITEAKEKNNMIERKQTFPRSPEALRKKKIIMNKDLTIDDLPTKDSSAKSKQGKVPVLKLGTQKISNEQASKSTKNLDSKAFLFNEDSLLSNFNDKTDRQSMTEKNPQTNKKLLSLYNILGNDNIYHSRFTKKPSQTYYMTYLQKYHTNPNESDYFCKLYREHFIQTYEALRFCSTLGQVNQKKLCQKKVYLSKRETHKDKKTLVFDLDETLIHCNQSLQAPYDVKLSIKLPYGDLVEAGINIRPYAIECLQELSQYYEIIIFTASHSHYADVVIDYLDPKKHYIHHRLYREHCIQTDKGMHIKDLRILANRNLNEVFLIDNTAYSFGYQLDNGIPIIPYYYNKNDQELKLLTKYLKYLSSIKNPKDVNKSTFKFHLYPTFNNPQALLSKLIDSIPSEISSQNRN